LGLIESCTELAEVLGDSLRDSYASRLVLQANLEQTRREKLLINLIIFASLRANSSQGKSQMFKWLQSLFQVQQSEMIERRTTVILMTGMC
jgi:hypothetical protein